MSLLKTRPDEYLSRGSLDPITYTGLRTVDALLGRDVWSSASAGPLQISFSFVAVGSRFDATSEEAESAMPMPTWVQAIVRECVALYEGYIDVRFTEVQETATQCGVIRFCGLKGSSPDMAAFAYMPSLGPWGGDVFIYEDQFTKRNADYLKATVLHEIGHALGLKHPFEPETYNPVILSKDMDQITLTLMSYTDVADLPGTYLLNYPETLMPLDIVALQYLYGPSRLSLGDDLYDLSNERFSGPFALFDAGGVDTLDARGLAQGVAISLTPNVWSDIGTKVFLSNGTFFRDTLIIVESFVENVRGSEFDDTVEANAKPNYLELRSGFDVVLWDAPVSSFNLSYNAGSWQVREIQNAQNLDTLSQVEKLVFSDKELRIESQEHGTYADLPVEIYQFFVVAFDAAPGVTYLNQLAEAYRYGLSVRQIVEAFTTKSQFTDLYPKSLSNSQLAESLVRAIVKDSASAQVKAEAIKDIQDALGFGLSTADVIYNVFGNLAKLSVTDPKWGGTVKLFQNEISVAKVYSEVMNQSTTDLVTLRAAISAVTKDTDLGSQKKVIDVIIAGLLEESPTPLGQSRLVDDSNDDISAILEAEWSQPRTWIDPIGLS